jgi:hypothetical protein
MAKQPDPILPTFKSTQIIRAFEITEIFYAFGNLKRGRLSESRYFARSSDARKPVSHCYLAGFVGKTPIEVKIDLAYYKLFDPRIGGIYVKGTDGEESYMRNAHFNAHFKPSKVTQTKLPASKAK